MMTVECYKCHRTGHLARVCPSGFGGGRGGRGGYRGGRSGGNDMSGQGRKLTDFFSFLCT